MHLSPEDFLARFEALKAALVGTPIEDDLEAIRLVRGNPEVLAQSHLSEFDKKFLAETGLPDGVSDLTFEALAQGPLFLWEFEPQREWTPENKAPFEELRLLGSDANGDSLCVEESTGAVFTLNHDSHFERIFVNSSLLQLAYCAVIRLFGPVTQMKREQVNMQLAVIDPQAAQIGRYWSF